MSFKRIKGSDRGMIRRTISATAFAVGDLLQYHRSNAIVVVASASTEVDNLAGIVCEATTTADTTVLLQRIMPGDVYQTTTAAVALAADNYKRCIWATGHKVTNSGTDVADDTGIFVQTGLVGVTGVTTTIVGEFTTGSHGD